MINNLAPRSPRRGSVLVVGVLMVGSVLPVTPAAAAQGAVCGAKPADWLDPGGVTTYVGSMGTGKNSHTFYKDVFRGKLVTATAARAGDPDATDVAYRFAPGPRLAWEGTPRSDPSRFELKNPVCAGGGSQVTSAVATVAVMAKGSDTAAGPFYCESAYRVGKGPDHPPPPPDGGVCAPGGRGQP